MDDEAEARRSRARSSVIVFPEITELRWREKFAFMSPPSHTEERKRNALQSLIDTYLNPEAIRDAGIFDEKRMNAFIENYQNDRDPVSLVRKDALMNHVVGLQVLHRLFVQAEVSV